MSGFQNFSFISTLAAVLIAGVYTMAGRGQTAGAGSGIVVGFFAPPAIDVGLVPRLSRSPDSPESHMREAIRLVNVADDRVGRSGGHYIGGKLIGKFRSGASSAARLSAPSIGGASDLTTRSKA